MVSDNLDNQIMTFQGCETTKVIKKSCKQASIVLWDTDGLKGKC